MSCTETIIEKENQEIICVGRYQDMAIYLDENMYLAYIQDENEIIEPGDICNDESELIPVRSLPLAEQSKIVNTILKRN